MPRFFPWFNPPAPAPRTGMDSPAGLERRPRWSCWLGHSYVYTSQPHPGGPAYAYEALGLSEFSPIGPATVNRDQLRHFEVPGFASNAYWTSGLGGLVQGQFVSSPLVVPGTSQTELYLADMLPTGQGNWIGG